MAKNQYIDFLIMAMTDNHKYKFAFIVSLFFEYGGMQRTLFRIAEECSSRGHEVHVLTGGWIGEKSNNIEVHEFDTRALTNVWSNDILVRKVRQHIADNDYDCIVGFTKIPGLDVYYAGDPCYAARVDEAKGWFYKLLPRYRGFKRQEAAVFAPGTGTEILLIAHQEKQKCPDKIDRTAIRQSLGYAADENIILTVGSRFKTKGVDRSIQAIASLPDSILQKTRLIVVGGDRAGPYINMAKRLNIAGQVDFVGAQQGMARYYASADVLIHPPYSENTGTILIEAMLSGLPVLTTANCGFAFHVDKARAGLVCSEPFDQQQLSQNLLTMINADRSDWIRQGPEYCKRTDLYSLIEKAADIIIVRAGKNRLKP
jgi:UDP-glucose:(heptosyl)LPS alpha-1,3-glucosyltransferase